MKRLNIICIGVLTLLFTACKPTLSKTELKIINTDIPQELYAANVTEAVNPQNLYNELWEGVGEYIKQQERIIKKNERSLANNPFAAGFADLANILDGMGGGASKPSNKLERYIDFCNDHNEYLLDAVNKVTEVVQKHPGLTLEYVGDSDNLSLAAFSEIREMPETTFGPNFGQLSSTPIDYSNRANFGRCLMGEYNAPKYSVDVVVAQVMLRAKDVKIPYPVYAVFDEEEEMWLIGYNNEDAIAIQFEKDGKRVHYVWHPVGYYSGFVDSKENMLAKSIEKNKKNK